jgi:hypothetical protein
MPEWTGARQQDDATRCHTPMNLTTPRNLKPLGRVAQRKSPGRDEDWEVRRRRRLRRKVAAGSIVAVVLLAFLTYSLVQDAAEHYRLGQQALEEDRYLTALDEFNAAHILRFSYRDARALAVQAAAALDVAADLAREQHRVESAVTALVRRAAARVDAGDARGADTALAEARALVPDGTLSQEAVTLTLLDELAGALRRAAQAALLDARWADARAYATALLAVDPQDESGQRQRARSEKGTRLERRLDEARAAARRGQWRRALRLALVVQDAWRGFPGASALIARARAALAPKPSPTPTSAAVTPTPEPQPPAPPPPP